jgi:hypothetical protein
MSELTAADLQAITGASGDNLESWIARLSLSTAYEETVAGRARKFSRDNAVELGVIANLVKQGQKPAAAAEIAADLLKHLKTKKPKGWLTIFFDSGHFVISDEPPGPTTLTCVSVNIGQLQREIDEYLVKLSAGQTAAVEKMARTLLILEPQDRDRAVLTWVDEFAKAVRAKYPDLPEEKIESAVFRFGDLIRKRFNELNANVGGRA